ncbi:MAG: S-layer homology domain-containing protein [Clostridia bacterium]|nr:S-layer homology domain-containing protein [Clostridia bacterium]
MKTLKRTIAVLLTLILVSSSFVCFAADGEKQYHKYTKSVLLGDSLASGFRDYDYIMSEFTYVEDSYAAYLAKDLGVEQYTPMACPGFRTIELRTMLEDDYVSNDPYLFEAVPHHSAEEILAKKDEMRQAIAEADLITIAIGGNDWGAYLGWVMEDFIEDHPLPEEFEAALREYLAKASLEDNVIKTMVELAQTFNAVEEFLAIMPKAIEYAFSTLNENWPIIVEDIYRLNPDVTLVAVGMFNTTLSTPEGEPDNVAEPDPLAVKVEQMMIDNGNKPMIDNQEKYGYIYVDTTGTIVETAHPTAAGHRHIADRILEALPDARFSFSDVEFKYPAYGAMEYMYLNGYMNSISETTFGGDAKITKAEFSEILNKVTGSYSVTDSTSEVTKLELSNAVYNISGDTGIISLFKHFIAMIKLVLSGNGFKAVTRAEAAIEIYQIIK